MGGFFRKSWQGEGGPFLPAASLSRSASEIDSCADLSAPCTSEPIAETAKLVAVGCEKIMGM
jgi:hypothetical protein